MSSYRQQFHEGAPPHPPTRPDRMVIKIGTNVLTAGSDRLYRPLIVDIVRQVAALHHQGTQIILVSSGAVAAGWEGMGFPPRQQRGKDATISFKQVLAGVGQSRLMHLYEQYFEIYGLLVSQALLTRQDFDDRRRYLNARNTLLHSLEYGIVPIINENDAVATSEVRFGDNDRLSALVANLVDADLLLILTDTDGLFSGDPRRDPDAQLIPVVERIDEHIWEIAGGSGTHRGTGGMQTKIQAAELATRSGTTVVIANGNVPDVILRVARNEPLGTRFLTHVSNLESRKRWILAETVHRSRVVIDAGASEALLHGGGSLLPAGITHVEGDFDRGQTIRIFNPAGVEIARGISQYQASDVALIKGVHSSQIAAILGYAYGPEIVHRDDMVIL